jgi:4-amino-4-deoxy-L-arabinose transferase-like glycosyltransferase
MRFQNHEQIVAIASIALIAAALLAAPWRGHVDDVDAQLYQVLVRNMVATRSWLEPGVAPAQARPYRDHLPFGFWPYVAVARIAGERALPVLGAAFSLATVMLVTWLGWRLLGLEAAIGAGLVLSLTDTFFLYGGRARLDPPLLCFALAGAAPALFERPSARSWLLASGSAAVAALVKGPFGLTPLFCAVCARAVSDRSFGHFRAGALAVAAAALPAVIFLRVADKSWWDVYVRLQLVGSALGTRTDGSLSPWAALTSVAGRFWPGLPFVLLACVALAGRRRGQREAGMLALWCAFLLLALSLPRRKLWHHELVAYPALALLAGAGLRPSFMWLGRRPVAYGLAGVAAVLVAASAAGMGKLLLPAPCVPSRELAHEFDRIPAGTEVLVVSPTPNWELFASLAAERRLAPRYAPALPLAGMVALVHETAGPIPDPPWQEIGRSRGWALVRRIPPEK